MTPRRTSPLLTGRSGSRRPLGVLGRAGLLALLAAACSEHSEPERTTPPQEVGASQGEAAVVLPPAGDRVASDRHLARGREMERAVRAADARAEYELAASTDPRSLEARVQYGLSLLWPPDPSEGFALAEFRAALALAPEDPRALCGEGVVRARIGEDERARRLLERGLPGLPQSESVARLASESAAALSRIAWAAGDARTALSRLQQAVQVLGPNEADRRHALETERASILLQEDRTEEAAELLRGVLREDPVHLRAHHLFARALRAQGAEAEAVRHEEVHEILRTFGDGAARRFQEDHERRIALRRRLVELLPEYPRARLDLIREMLEVAAYSDAEREIEGEAARAGWSGELHYLLACAQAGAGDLAAAWRSATRMRAANPNVPPAVLLDVLDHWRKAQRPDERTYRETEQRWLRGEGGLP